MRKFIMGVIVGALLFSGVQVFADNLSLIGKKVGSEAELYLDGMRMSDVIIIDGKSFAPVREISEALGRSVYYTPATNGGKAVVNLSAALFAKEQRIKEINEKIDQLENEIDTLIKNGEELKRKFESIAEDDPSMRDQVNEAIAEDQNKRNETMLDLEAQLKGLKIELEALESAK